MLMTGDLNKVLVEVNKILEGAFKRIEALEDKVMALQAPKDVPLVLKVPKRGPGRPPGSKNKSKKAA